MSLKKVHFSEKTALRIVTGAQEGYIRTRDNHVVRLLCNDANGAYPIVGLIEREFGDVATQWTRQGKHDMRYNVKTPLDLIMFVPEEKGGEK